MIKTDGKIITDKLTQNFKTYLYDGEHSANTVEKYLRDIRAFAKRTGAKNLQKSDLLEYKKALCEKYSPQSVNSMISSLNAFFTFADVRSFSYSDFVSSFDLSANMRR